MVKCISLASLLVLFYSITVAQRQTDSTKVWLTVTDSLGKTLETLVNFRNEKDGHSFRFITNTKGVAICTVPSGQKYSVAIPSSEDMYFYNSPKSGLQEEQLSLSFSTAVSYETANQLNALLLFKIFNGGANPIIAARTSAGTEIKPYFENDYAYLKVPVNQSYTITAGGVSVLNSKIDVPDLPVNIQHYAFYFKAAAKAEIIPVIDSMAILFISHKNLQNQPVAREKITIQGKLKNKAYIGLTDTNGIAIVLVPKKDSYSLSLKYYPNFLDIDVNHDLNQMVSDKVSVRFPGTEEIEKRTREEQRLIAIRDSLYKIREKQNELTASQLNLSLHDEAALARKELEKDADYFKKTNNTVCAVLQRNLPKWSNKMIVTDVTGSMYPYMHQVALWHVLQLMNKEKSAYVFFNDGDNKPDDLKQIGKTGGVYYIDANAPDSIIKTMYKAMGNGTGGDAAENDIEALIKGEQNASADKEIVLIADNYAPVKDIQLLTELHRPIRIVLCGVNYSVGTDYLRLAYATGGSLHTIEEDIINLSALHDDDKIKVGGKTYQFIKGRFFLLESSKRI